MIRNPFLIIGVLLAIEIFILYISGHEQFKKYFRFLPSLFWIYFLPMIFSTAGLIDSQSPVYQIVINNLLPASLFLLLMTVDIKAILQLGSSALVMFLAGSFGVVFGTAISFSIFKKWVGGEFWGGFGALSGSWTGGSANMIAVKEALSVPDGIFLPMVVVDTIVPYLWMGVLVSLSAIQMRYDRWNQSDRRILDELAKRTAVLSSHKQVLSFKTTILILGLAVLASLGAQSMAKFLPVIKDVIAGYAWTIIIVSLAGIVLSLTRLRKLESYGTTKIGYFMLYLVITTIGAKANLFNMGSVMILIAAGFLIVFIHAGFLIVTSRLIKAPLFLVATASQANVGGVASAPIVAEVYQPGLASVGLLMAILGNIIGTYLGILAGQLCRFLI